MGLDIGNALAPWIFCLALDPIVRYSNRVPDVISMKAYMEDTNTAGIGHKWLQQTQSMWEAIGSMGLIIAKHTCIKIGHLGNTTTGPSAARIVQGIMTKMGEVPSSISLVKL